MVTPYVQGLLQGHPHVDTPFMGGAAFAQKTFLEVQYWTSGGREVIRLKKDTAHPSRNSEKLFGERNKQKTHKLITGLIK